MQWTKSITTSEALGVLEMAMKFISSLLVPTYRKPQRFVELVASQFDKKDFFKKGVFQ